MTAVLIAYLEKDLSRWVHVTGGTAYSFHWEGATKALLADMQACMAIELLRRTNK
jgi:hypothetical protein